jgi:hypothetical protein
VIAFESEQNACNGVGRASTMLADNALNLGPLR